jgi:deoxyribodipyrimidine photo-lyase
MQKLESEPRIEFENMVPGMNGLRENSFNQTWFERWQQGSTGYPMIDACMRMLNTTGWLNFRMRSMLVSFASYNLWLHWRAPAHHLARQFLDYEPGIHYSQMHMQSGTTGINTLRIYNPVKQALDHDVGGSFVRRWVPELRALSDAHLLEPWKMSSADQSRSGVRIGIHYPAPIVDWAASVKAARARLTEFRQRDDVRAQTAQVMERHGSRKSGMNITGERKSKAQASSQQLSLNLG